MIHAPTAAGGTRAAADEAPPPCSDRCIDRCPPCATRLAVAQAIGNATASGERVAAMRVRTCPAPTARGGDADWAHLSAALAGSTAAVGIGLFPEDGTDAEDRLNSAADARADLCRDRQGAAGVEFRRAGGECARRGPASPAARAPDADVCESPRAAWVATGRRSPKRRTSMNEFDDEIVWVKDGHHLIDAESYERRYSIDSRRSVMPGYYVAEWPAGSGDHHFLDEHLVLTGPYRTRMDAQAAARARVAIAGA